MVIEFNGIPINVEDQGSGEPLVLLHGFLENNTIWDRFVPLLKDKYRVIRPDLFGHGKTPSAQEVYSMRDFADSIAAVLDALHIKTATFIGHSMGGYVTLAFLENYPHRIDALMLLNSTSKPDSEDRVKERNRAIKIVKKRKKDYVRSSISNLFAESSRVKYKDVLEHHVTMAAAQESQAIIASLKGMRGRKERTETLKAFTGKKSIVTGEKDPIIPLAEISEVAEYTHSNIYVLPDGHMSYIEQQKKVEEAFKEFLSLS